MANSSRPVWKETPDYIFTTGDHYSTNEQIELNNEATQEYFTNKTVDLHRFETVFIAQYGLIGGLSLYMHTSDGTFVGFSRTAIRGPRAWLAGISIVPAFRSRGVGSLLFREYLNLLAERSSISVLQFECIANNERAMKMYVKFGSEVGEDLYFYDLEVGDSEADAGGLDMTVEDRVDLRLPWLQHVTNYPWQREFSILLAGVNRQYVFRRDGGFELGIVVDVDRETPRINGVAYDKRPTAERFRAALRLLSADLQKTKFELVNEPASSDFTGVVEVVGKRWDMSQKHLVLKIEPTGVPTK